MPRKEVHVTALVARVELTLAMFGGPDSILGVLRYSDRLGLRTIKPMFEQTGVQEDNSGAWKCKCSGRPLWCSGKWRLEWLGARENHYSARVSGCSGNPDGGRQMVLEKTIVLEPATRKLRFPSHVLPLVRLKREVE